MSSARGEQSSVAERVFFRTLRDLHRRAGEPSSRSIASAIGGMSHTTVNSALKGTKIPSWPIVAKIVEQLNGDLSEFQRLWVETRENVQDERLRMRSEVSVFVSYARVDDAATHGRVSRLVRDIGNTYESMTGQSVGVFQDVDSISPGEEWKDRIRLGLASSSIFLAFVSPAFLRSAFCREELSEYFGFLDANSSARLVVPLVYADPLRIEKAFAQDALWKKIAQRQVIDISSLRFAQIGSSEWIQKTSEIAEAIEEILSEQNPNELASESADAAKLPEAAKEGFLDRFEEIERRAPQVGEDLGDFARLLGELGAKTEAATPAMVKADSFGKKLALTNSLASDLSPIAAQMKETAQRLVDNLSDWDELINFAIGQAKSDINFFDDPGAIEFIVTAFDMANAGVESLGYVEQLSDSIGPVLGMSRRLDIPLRTIREACLHMADLRGLMIGWKSELEALEQTHPKAFGLPES